MKRLFKRITALASAAALTLSLAACGGSAVSGPKNTAPTNAKPVTITVWTYYNGDQLETFSKLVDEFNATVGKEQNITVEASSQGSVNDLETNVLAAAEGKVGAAEMPNIFSAYADTCYAVELSYRFVQIFYIFCHGGRSNCLPGLCGGHRGKV